MPDLFSSKLEMSTVPLPQEASAVLWSDILVNRVAVILAIVLLLIEISDILILIPHLFRCLPFWKGNMELEHSVSVSRTRNTVALVAVVLFCVVADAYSLFDPSWRTLAPPEYSLLLTAAIVTGFFVIRGLFYLVSPLRSRTAEFACTVRHTFFNYFILFALLAVVTAVLMAALGAGVRAARVVLIVEASAFYLFNILRTSQILSSRYGVFATFLYLCALEFLPAGILIVTCTR
ncbi:MAG: DUF4271 domain-containing protein [Bacteroidales bacterium]|nr:DUF4271 domain-containing protein [Bacteroidales bacterium]